MQKIHAVEFGILCLNLLGIAYCVLRLGSHFRVALSKPAAGPRSYRVMDMIEYDFANLLRSLEPSRARVVQWDIWVCLLIVFLTSTFIVTATNLSETVWLAVCSISIIGLGIAIRVSKKS